MAAAHKFDNFINDLVNGVHKNSINTGSPTDTWKLYLTNATPDAANDAVKADLAEIATINGYGGAQNIGLQRSQSGGVITLSASDVVITAATGSPQGVGPFRYVVLGNSTPVVPLFPLICWWDYTQSLTLDEGQTFTIDMGTSLATIQ